MCAVVTTRTCPLNTGRASRNAATFASRRTKEAGTSPRTMAQNTQGAATATPLHGPRARRVVHNASCREHSSFTARFHPAGRAVSGGKGRAASACQGDDGNAQANCPPPHRCRRLRWRRRQGPGPRRHAEQASDIHGISGLAAAGEQHFRKLHDRPELHRRRSLAVPRPDGGGGRRVQRSHRRVSRSAAPRRRGLRPDELRRDQLHLGPGLGPAQPRRLQARGLARRGRRQLRLGAYAERDARRMHAILTRLGGVRPEDARLLTGASADEVRRALADLAARADQAKARGEETVLVVYYSGHAKEGELRLGDTRMPLVELREALRSAPADVRIGLLDSCQSGAITRPKGVRTAPAFDVQQAQAASTRPRGLVLIASSSADEESQESDEIGASFFTHYLASGLLGDADASGDGKVTLAEAYAYAYARTVGETAETRAGA